MGESHFVRRGVGGATSPPHGASGGCCPRRGAAGERGRGWLAEDRCVRSGQLRWGDGVAMYTREHLLSRGVTARELALASLEGRWLRLQPGVYVDRAAHLGRNPADRHRSAVDAAMWSVRGGSAVVSHLSAAVIHGLPQYRFGDRAVEVTLSGKGGGSSRPGLRRHLDALPEQDVVEIDGTPCTSLDRTVFDVARTAPLEMASPASMPRCDVKRYRRVASTPTRRSDGVSVCESAPIARPADAASVRRDGSSRSPTVVRNSPAKV